MKTEKMNSRVKRLINILDRKFYHCPQKSSRQSKEIIELLIEFFKGNISKMKLAEVLRLSFSKTKIYVEKIEKICNLQPKNQKVIAEGKVHYWGTLRGRIVYIGSDSDDLKLLDELAGKLYRYRGKNIKLIVEEE